VAADGSPDMDNVAQATDAQPPEQTEVAAPAPPGPAGAPAAAAEAAEFAQPDRGTPDPLGAGPLTADHAPTLDGNTLEMMLDLPLDVTVELGRTAMQLGEALALKPGAIIELDRLPGEPLDMHVNDRLVARGEVVVINDALGLRITEIIGKPAGTVG